MKDLSNRDPNPGLRAAMQPFLGRPAAPRYFPLWLARGPRRVDARGVTRVFLGLAVFCLSCAAKTTPRPAPPPAVPQPELEAALEPEPTLAPGPSASPAAPVSGSNGVAGRNLDQPRVGILHSLSGTISFHEAPLMNTVLMAIDEVNRSGGVL